MLATSPRVSHSLVSLWITWHHMPYIGGYQQPWSTLSQMSPRGHWDPSCHIKVLCIHGEKVKGAEAQTHSLHYDEDLWKCKGNVEKSASETSHLKACMDPSHGTTDTYICSITDPKLICSIQAKAFLRDTLVFHWCLLCFCSWSSGSDWGCIHQEVYLERGVSSIKSSWRR